MIGGRPSGSKSTLWIPNPGIWKTAHLDAFLPEFDALECSLLPKRPISAVAGWGHARTSAFARASARRLSLPYVALEDGFIRSVGMGRSGAQPLSLVADRSGIYYDARQPSDLEFHILHSSTQTAETLAAADEFLALKQTLGLSKYNSGRRLGRHEMPPSLRLRVLVIGQVKSDVSIEGALKDDRAFFDMMRRAKNDYPNADILLKRHPAARSGHAAVSNEAAELASHVFDEDLNLIDLIRRCDVVYTVSSLAGLEALLLGKPVICMGMPFYAGWGLTQDDIPLARRTARPSLRQLTAAAYIQYARYVDPLSGKQIDARAALLRLAGFRDHAERVRGSWVALDIPPPKRPVIRAFLSSPVSSVRFQSSHQPDRPPRASDKVVAWSSRLHASPAPIAHTAIVRMEDGFLRSAGLGSSFYPASSLVIDDLGIYYDPLRPSRLERILSDHAFSVGELSDASLLLTDILALQLTKYNLRQAAPLDLSRAASRRRLFVPGQVEDDASVLTGGFGMTNSTLLRRVRTLNPGAFITFKQHPDVIVGNRRGRLDRGFILDFADLIADDADVLDCIHQSDEVHTLTSLTGFEAILRGKPVSAYGIPFYAGWGLTRDLCDPAALSQRRRKLSLLELIAGALILYPLYIDPDTGLPLPARDYVARLASQKQSLRSSGLGPGRGTRFRRFIRAVQEMAQTSRMRAY